MVSPILMHIFLTADPIVICYHKRHNMCSLGGNEEYEEHPTPI